LAVWLRGKIPLKAKPIKTVLRILWRIPGETRINETIEDKIAGDWPALNSVGKGAKTCVFDIKSQLFTINRVPPQQQPFYMSRLQIQATPKGATRAFHIPRDLCPCEGNLAIGLKAMAKKYVP
jgi:hypothetical protein